VTISGGVPPPGEVNEEVGESEGLSSKVEEIVGGSDLVQYKPAVAAA